MALLRDPAAPPLPDWLLDDLVRRAPTGPTARLTRDLPGLIANLLVGRLGEVKTPADLLWGASDQLMTLAYGERMLAQLPAARLTLLEHCGHIPQLECAPAFVAALEKPSPRRRCHRPGRRREPRQPRWPDGMISADVLGERARLTPDATALVVVEPASAPDLSRARRARGARRARPAAPGDRSRRPGGTSLAQPGGVPRPLLRRRQGGLCPRASRHAAHCARDRPDPRRQRRAPPGLRRRARRRWSQALRALPDAPDRALGRTRWLRWSRRRRAAGRLFSALTTADPAGFAPTPRDPEDLYCLLYTSGTTGRPKGVMIPHRQVAWNGYNTVAGWQLTADRRLADLHAALPRRRPDGLPRADLHRRRHDRPAPRLRSGRDLAHGRARGLHGDARRADDLEAARRSAGIRRRRSGVGALPVLRRRAAPHLDRRALPAARPGLQAGLRHDRGRGQLLRHDGRGLSRQARLDRQADDAHRGPVGRRGRPGRSDRRGRRALVPRSRTSPWVTGGNPRRRRRRTSPAAGSAPAIWRAATTRASSPSPDAPRR